MPPTSSHPDQTHPRHRIGVSPRIPLPRSDAGRPDTPAHTPGPLRGENLLLGLESTEWERERGSFSPPKLRPFASMETTRLCSKPSICAFRRQKRDPKGVAIPPTTSPSIENASRSTAEVDPDLRTNGMDWQLDADVRVERDPFEARPNPCARRVEERTTRRIPFVSSKAQILPDLHAFDPPRPGRARSLPRKRASSRRGSSRNGRRRRWNFSRKITTEGIDVGFAFVPARRGDASFPNGFVFVPLLC